MPPSLTGALSSAPNASIPLNFRKRMSPVGDEKLSAAGVLFVTPEGDGLFLRRTDKGDHGGEWSIPAGRVEQDEEPADAARRECVEEIGTLPTWQLNGLHRETSDEGVDFATFGARVPERFDPTLNHEHDEYVWAPLKDPPQPLHPGMASALKQFFREEAEEPEHKASGAAAKLAGDWNETDRFSMRQRMIDRRLDAARERDPRRRLQLERDADYLDDLLREETEERLGRLEKDEALAEDVKEAKEEVDYREGHGEKRCGECTMFEGPRGCMAVDGDIAPDGLCDLFKAKPGEAGDQMGGGAVEAFESGIPQWGELEGVNYGARDRTATDSALRLPLALDETANRWLDKDGRLHIEETVVCKACVNPYKGSEIPDWEELGLDPDRIYKMLRPPEELEKATSTMNGIPLMRKHIPISADDHQPYDVAGTVGTTARWEDPFIKDGLVIWAAKDIEGIDNKEKCELSPGYHYKPRMVPGVFKGENFDGRMEAIVFNHLAIVEEARQGADLTVADSIEEMQWSVIESMLEHGWRAQV